MVLQTEFAQIRNKTLYIDDVDAMDLVKQYGTPLYVMSEGHMRYQMNELKEKFLDKYENVLPLFASKSFSCLEIYKLAKEYGIGIDCVSAGEISIALKAGFDPHKIYFCLLYTSLSKIERGVNYPTFDTLEKIMDVLGVPPNELLSGEWKYIDHTEPYIMANYGMEVIDSGSALLCMHAPYEVSSNCLLYTSRCV